MTRDEAVAEIQQNLSFRIDLTDNIRRALIRAQELIEFEPELPWFLITEMATETTTVGEERIQVPSDFLRELEQEDGGGLWWFNPSAEEEEDKWTELVKTDLGNLRREYYGEGAPKAYALDNKNFRIGPEPDDIYQLKMMYYARAERLTGNIENAWLRNIPSLLIGMAGGRIAAAVRDEKALEYFRQEEQRGRATVKMQNEARLHSNIQYVMGGKD